MKRDYLVDVLVEKAEQVARLAIRNEQLRERLAVARDTQQKTLERAVKAERELEELRGGVDILELRVQTGMQAEREYREENQRLAAELQSYREVQEADKK